MSLPSNYPIEEISTPYPDYSGATLGDLGDIVSQVSSFEEAEAVLAAAAQLNKPNIENLTFSLDATEALVSPGSVAPQLSGVFANAGRVEVNNVTTASDAVVLNGSSS